jgi:hypothetical protein
MLRNPIRMLPSVKPRLPDNVQAALEDTVGLKGEEKKWGVLAMHLGMSEGMLRNKVAPEREDKRHYLTLAEALSMVKESGNPALVHAICNAFGGEFLRYPGITEGSDNELLSRYTSMMRELGQFSNDIHVSLADGKISPDEIATLRKDFLHLSGALHEIMDRLQDRANRDTLAAKASR